MNKFRQKTADKMYGEMGEWIEMSYKQECERLIIMMYIYL